MSNLFDKTTDALATSIRMRQLRQNVTQSNIANAETPGFHAKRMDFEDTLARALDLDGTSQMSTTHNEHFAIGSTGTPSGEIYDNPDVAVNNDGNTVDLEKEMSALAENTIINKAAMQLINKKMAALKYAISEGR
jgi:flagellar basal-body rod protein FlgB